MASPEARWNCFWHAALLGQRSVTLELNGTSGIAQHRDAGSVWEALVTVECVWLMAGLSSLTWLEPGR